MSTRSVLGRLALAVSLAAGALNVHAANEQYFPLQSYRVGPYAAGGTGFFGGFIDYLKYVNAQGGVNGVKLTWSECETEYVVEKGVECYERLKGGLNGAPAAATNPLSVIAHPLKFVFDLQKTSTDEIAVLVLSFDREVETAIYNTLPHNLDRLLRRHPLQCPVGFIGGRNKAVPAGNQAVVRAVQGIFRCALRRIFQAKLASSA